MSNPPPTAYREAVELLSSAQKPSYGAPLYSRLINRPLGRRFAARAFTLGATPNQVTTASALASLVALACAALIPPHWWLGLLVSGFLVLGYGLDAADGQLARLRGGGSPAGEWLDHMVDVAKISVLHAAVLISWFRFDPEIPKPFLLIPLGYALVSNVFFFGFILINQLRITMPSATPREPRAGSGLAQSVLAMPTDYGILCVIFLSFGFPPLFLVVYGLMFLGHTVVLLGAIRKWWHELTTAARA
jgi:phosphatidylglycerophosphate synthase